MSNKILLPLKNQILMLEKVGVNNVQKFYLINNLKEQLPTKIHICPFTCSAVYPSRMLVDFLRYQLQRCWPSF